MNVSQALQALPDDLRGGIQQALTFVENWVKNPQLLPGHQQDINAAKTVQEKIVHLNNERTAVKGNLDMVMQLVSLSDNAQATSVIEAHVARLESNVDTIINNWISNLR